MLMGGVSQSVFAHRHFGSSLQSIRWTNTYGAAYIIIWRKTEKKN